MIDSMHDASCLSAVCVCGISLSYSLTIYNKHPCVWDRYLHLHSEMISCSGKFVDAIMSGLDISIHATKHYTGNSL